MTHDPKSSYYGAGDLEVFAIMKAKLTPDQYKGYMIGAAMKYICRCNFKHDSIERDVEKAISHLQKLQEVI